MIHLTKLDQTKIMLCFDNVKYIESTPDTLIFFTNGESIFVKESLEEIEARFIAFQKSMD